MVADSMQFEKVQGHFLACVVCWLLGAAFLFPWNSILTVGDYYYAVFPSYHPSRVFTLIYQPIGLVTSLIFTWYEARCSTRLRVLAGFSLFFIMILLLIVVDLATSGQGSVGAYVAVCFLIAGCAIADGTSQGGILGDLSLMEPAYIQAYSGGLAVAGVSTSVLRLITKVAFGGSSFGLRKGALTFLGIAAFTQLCGLTLYSVVFPRVPAVKAYRLKAMQQGSLTVSDDLAVAGVKKESKDAETGSLPPRLSVTELCVQNWDYLVDMVIIYTVSLSIFPGFLYEDTGNHKLGAWYPLVLITMYNSGDLIGRCTPLIDRLLVHSRTWLAIWSWARLAFIPCFYFAAKYADQGWMIFLCIMLGWTNGHLSTNIFMVAPNGYTGPEQNAVGNILVLFLILGLSIGVTADWLWLIGKGW
ncbi:unnamed protein product [Sphagnum jensenii]|uniref:Equilibrative nucleoside transporter n=1 Tax=Sphagnum jensenii TaxID=128206 RepID=A0ABP1C2Q6_9BRYO